METDFKIGWKKSNTNCDIYDLLTDENNISRSPVFKVEECNEPSCEALIFLYRVVLFNIFSN